MCQEHANAEYTKALRWLSFNATVAIATVVGLLTGYVDSPALNTLADAIAQIFINLLKLVSLPIIFLSILSTASRMEGMREVRSLGMRIGKYTFATTIIAATVALGLFVVINPVNVNPEMAVALAPSVSADNHSYWHYLINTIPSNIIQPFIDNNVIGVLLLALALSLAIITLPTHDRKVLHSFFSSLYAAIMKITTWLIAIMPVAIWAFITLFIHDLRGGLEISSIAWYLLVVVAANIIQAVVVLPLFLKSKGLSPIKIAKGMFPALSVAFFSKSSSGALPMTMKCVQENVGVSPKIANFTLPMCTTMNMNGCAAFILATVLFVSMSHGVTYTGFEMAAWILIATIAAIGNAGVPMGCYFLTSALLAAMNVPLNILAIILPFYTFIDMLETSINVWSDSCVAVMVEEDVKAEPELAPVLSMNETATSS